jgi:hypothetical protein
LQDEDKISRTKEGCACFRDPAELDRSATEDQGGGCAVFDLTQLMPVVVVVPGQRDEAKG